MVENKFIKTDTYEIYNYDCIEMMDLLIAQGKQVDLTVTSPPYDDLRDYEKSLVWNFDVFKQVANRLYDITKEGGVVVWVVGDSVKKGSKTLRCYEQALYFKSIGFNIYDVIIYEKTSPSPPHKNRYFNSFEYQFILSKGKPKTVNLLKDRPNKCAGTKSGIVTRREENGSLTKKKSFAIGEFGTRTNIWTYDVGNNKSTTDKFAFKHPAIFPEKLAQDHILSWSNETDTVLDCFMGSCTTGKMALLNNRNFIGIEKVNDYFEIGKQRIEESLHKETN